MLIKGITDEDFVNYKKPCMFISTSTCNFKCEIENGTHCCQNSSLVRSPNIAIPIDRLVERYLSNKITHAICFGGLEPMDQSPDLLAFFTQLRTVCNCNDDVVIYTGYYKEEIQDVIEQLRQFPNVIVKFGRYIPGQEKHYDEMLGVNLASDNQYGEKIS